MYVNIAAEVTLSTIHISGADTKITVSRVMSDQAQNASLVERLVLSIVCGCIILGRQACWGTTVNGKARNHYRKAAD